MARPDDPRDSTAPADVPPPAEPAAVPHDPDEAHLPPPGTDAARDLERKTPPARTRGGTDF